MNPPTRPQLRVLVLGTGTGVGKTVVSAALVRANPRAVGLKPIESGVSDGERAVGLGADGAAIQGPGFAVPPVPYLFAEPISPHLAAARTGARIDMAVVAAWVDSVRSVSGKVPEVVVVESAGGAFSPVGPSLYNADMIEACDFDHFVLVAPNRLGVLHDVVATLLALGRNLRFPVCVLLNDVAPPDADPARELNLAAVVAEVEVLSPSSIVLAVRWSEPDRAASAFWRLVGSTRPV